MDDGCWASSKIVGPSPSAAFPGSSWSKEPEAEVELVLWLDVVGIPGNSRSFGMSRCSVTPETTFAQVASSPPRWEIGLYAAGALALLGIAAVNLWKLWRSGSYPAPSPFPNYDYRYLEQKYGAAYPDVRHKRGLAPGSQRTLGRSSPSRKSSLRAEDTLESIQELGSLELMGRDLGLAHYGPLKKSISADSLNSISSIGNNFGQDFTVGQVEVSMEYDGKAAALHVTLLQGKDLLEKEDARFESCFMRISLLPAEQIVGISRELSLRVTVAESGEDGRGDNTGHVLIGPTASGMGTTHWNQMLATLRKPVSMWHPLRRN
ncbi:synaptotagmin-12-like protein [Willisornis vidua]|uniref:Synaptotagmin-12-like protein n=1 Tax=Willisornis vidua TaxID=1566151 RepID=A0ABQ9DJM2_9PASS|nr:synaptotagmin-12-like protein [Willisornis vidua]